MKLVNWKDYDISHLEHSSSTNYHLESNYSTEYMKNFKTKMKVLQQNNISMISNDNNHIVCFAQFFPLYLEPVWVPIACDTVLKDSYFLCEFVTDVLSLNHYKRSSTQCRRGFISSAGMCWKIINQPVITRSPSHVELQGLQHHLSAWSYGQESRNTIGIGYWNNLHHCLKSNSFLLQRAKHYQGSTDCADTENNYTLVSQRFYTYSFICNTNSQYLCDQHTCILHTYVCDGIYDCFDQSDEANCTVPLTANSCADDADTCEHHSLVYNGCAALYYECLSGECVPLAHRCDQHAHCQDNSDEVNCYIHEVLYRIPSSSTTKVSCLSSCKLKVWCSSSM